MFGIRRLVRHAAYCGALALMGAVAGAAPAQQPTSLRIGSSGSLVPRGTEEAGALSTLQNFIKTETGLDNEIVRLKNWQQLAEKMASKDFQIGVFQGYEFAWAQVKYPALKPLALAVNTYRYPVAYIVTRKDAAAAEFAGLKGQSLELAGEGVAFLQMFVARHCEELGAKADDFFSKVATTANVEDALDDLVDGKVQAVAADRMGLEAYKRRKPGRFQQLKPVVQSKPYPGVVIAYCDDVLGANTLQRFRDGLVNASQKESGQTLLTLFHLTGFEPVPDDFNRVLAETREAYPAPSTGK